MDTVILELTRAEAIALCILADDGAAALHTRPLRATASHVPPESVHAAQQALKKLRKAALCTARVAMQH